MQNVKLTATLLLLIASLMLNISCGEKDPSTSTSSTSTTSSSSSSSSSSSTSSSTNTTSTTQASGWEQVFWGPMGDANAIFATSLSTCCAGFGNGSMEMTSDGGANWTPVLESGGGNLEDIFFSSSLVGYAVKSSALYKTVDGGASWTSLGITAGSRLSFIDENHGWAVSGSSVYYTENAGSSWAMKSAGSAEELNDIWAIDIDNIVAVGNNGIIRRTTDNWSTNSAGFTTNTNKLNAVCFADSLHGWAVGNNGTIEYTSDGGANWNHQTSGTTRELYDVSFATANIGWAVGTYGTMLYTENGGITWTTQNPNVGVTFIHRIFAYDEDHAWAACGGGPILKYSR